MQEPESPPADDEREEPDVEDALRREVRRRGLGALLGLLDSGARRGQEVVSEVAKGSKDELVRLISAEVRGFLDKMDVVDLAQQVVAGLRVDVHAQIRFSRDADGRIQPEVTRSETKLASDEPGEAARKPGR